MFKTILSIGTIQALAVFLLLIKSKITAVYLGPAGVGVTGTIDQFVQLIAFLITFGIPESSIKFLSQSHSEGHQVFKKTYAGFFKLLLLLSLVGVILAVSVTGLYPGIFGDELGKYRQFLILALIMLPTFVLGIFFVKVFAAAQKPKASSLLVVIMNAVTTMAVTVGVITAGIFGLYLSSLVANIILITGVAIYLGKSLNLTLFERDTKILEELRRSPDIISLSLIQFFGFVSNSFSYFVARYAVLENFGETDAGLLHAVIALSLAISMILIPAVKLYFAPIVSRNILKADKIRHAVEFQRKMIMFASLIALPVILFPQLMLTVLFSPRFTEAGEIVYLFVIAQFVFVLVNVNQALLVGTDDLRSYTIITVGGQLLFALLSLFFVPHFGIKGVAFAHLIASSLMFLLTLTRLIQKHDFYVSINLLLLLGYSMSVLVFAGWLINQSIEWQLFTALSKIAFFLLFAAGFFLFLKKAEKEVLYDVCNRFFFRNKLSK